VEVKVLIVFLFYGMEMKVGNTQLSKETRAESKSLVHKINHTKPKEKVGEGIRA
jgi:hypothetical protein